MSEPTNNEDLKKNVTDTNVWKCLLLIIMFAILYSVAEIVIYAVVIFQFLHMLITGKKNKNALNLGAQLSTYAYQIFSFITFNSDHRPFPMSDWPVSTTLVEADAKPAPRKAAAKKPAAKKPAARKTPAKKEAPKPAAPKVAEKTDDKPAGDEAPKAE